MIEIEIVEIIGDLIVIVNIIKNREMDNSSGINNSKVKES